MLLNLRLISSLSRPNSTCTCNTNSSSATALATAVPPRVWCLEPSRTRQPRGSFHTFSSRRVAPSEERRRQQSPQDEASAARRASVKLPQLITRQIAAASSLAQLHDIVAANGSRLNHIHVARLLTRTSQLATHASTAGASTAAAGAAAQQQQQQSSVTNLQQQQDEEQHLQLLCSSLGVMMAQRARHATPETLVAAVAAMGRLKSLATGEPDVSSRAAAAGQPQQQLQQLAARAVELKEHFSISQLSALMWGLAKAGLNPARTWLDTILDAAMQQYQLAYEQQQQQQPGEQQQLADLPNQQPQAARDRHAGPAGPQLLQRPTLPQLNQQQQQQQQPAVSLRQTRRQPLLHQHSLATDLALIMYAAAVMGKPPQQQWLLQWQAAVLHQLPAANPQDLSQMLWGLGALGVNPVGQQWLEQVLLTFAEKLDQCGSQALANSIWAIQRLTRPQQQQHQQKQQQQAASGQTQLPPPLPVAWQQAFLEALYTEPSLATNPQSLSCCLASVARLRMPLDPGRVAALLDHGTDHLTEYAPRQLAETLWACASLSIQPSPAWLKAFLATAARAADTGRFSVQQLATVVWSLAVVKPPTQALLMSQQLQVLVMLQALAAAHEGQGLRHLGPAGRGSLAWALASLGIVPDKSWLAQFLTAAFADGLAADQVRCASILFCLASLDFDFLVEWLGDFLEGKYGGDEGSAGGVGLDLSLKKYAALAGVLGALAEMDSKQLRAAWLDQTLTPEWSAGAANEGLLGSTMQLPPALAAWVDTLAEPNSSRAAEQPVPPTATSAAP